MKIRWYGHACFLIRSTKNIVTDPHDGKSIGLPEPKIRSEIVTISHNHFDHNCSRIVQGNPTIVNTVGKKEVLEVNITGINSYHDDCQGAKRGENIIFKINIEDMTICHLGDLGEIPSESQIKEIGSVDILFIPVGGTYTLNSKEALEVAKILSPKVVVPMHYRVHGLSLPIQPVDNFLKLVKNYTIYKPGNEMHIDASELQEKTEIWKFDL